MTAYYNEIDPYAAQWLRNLISAGHIAPGFVDERSIEDVTPNDLAGYTQCHFFAGIGVWSHALRQAGWPDDKPVWTGSCPCQPFSAAGKGNGFADERHLWPAFHHLIEQCRPATVIGEQVASKDADVWIDLVQADLEALDYAFAAIPFPSAGIGAPHIRDRLYWVGDTRLAQCERITGVFGGASGAVQGKTVERAGVHPSGMADSSGERCDGINTCVCRGRSRQNSVKTDWRSEAVQRGRFLSAREIAEIPYAGGYVDPSRNSGPTNGYWRDADWLLCRDGKFRPVEPGTFPLAHGATSRVGRLRAYGNAINAQAAQAFIECLK